MSTRALYTFKDSPNSKRNEDAAWNVYKHHDGFPRGAYNTINDALTYFAWQLPRFEADEFAAAFCAAGKAWSMIKAIENNDVAGYHTDRHNYGRFSQGGGVRFMPRGKPQKVAQKNCSDIEYRYEITARGDVLYVKAFEVQAWETYEEKLIFEGGLGEFYLFSHSKENV